MSSFNSTSSSSSSFSSSFSSSSSSSSFVSRSVTSTSNNGVQPFEKKRKELSNGTKWVLRLISPIVKPADSDEEKIEIPDDWSRGRFWRGV